MGKHKTLTYLDGVVRQHHEHQLAVKPAATLGDALAFMRSEANTRIIRLISPLEALQHGATEEEIHDPERIFLWPVDNPVAHEFVRQGADMRQLYNIQLEIDSIAPFVTNHPAAVALQCDESLINAFMHAHVPDVDTAFSLLLKHCWYIDVNGGGLDFTDENGRRVTLRAIFVNPITALPHELCYHVDPPRPVVFVNYDYGVPSEKLGEDVLYWTWAKDYESPLGLTSYGMRQVETFILLSILYLSTLHEEKRDTLPRLCKRDYTGKKPITQQKALSQSSLFRVIALSPPPDNFGRAVTGGRAGWHLNERITVRGHFKMQAYGPRHSERELRWIDAYQKGPRDAPAAPPPLYRLSNSSKE